MKRYYLIYDDSCDFCTRTLRRLKKLDRADLLTAVPLSDPEIPLDIKMPPRSRLEEEIHLVTPEGEIKTGSDAIARVMSVFPRSRWLGKILALPIIRSLARPIYRLIAQHRPRDI